MMTAMVKKAVLGTAGLAVAGGFVFGRDLWSYVSTAGSSVQEAVRESVPLEFELKRAKDMLKSIDPEMNRAKKLVVEQQVEIEDLEKKLVSRADQVAGHRNAVMTRSDQLKTGNTTFTISNKSYTADQLTDDLKSRFETLKAVESAMQEEQKLLKRRQEAMKANLAKLDMMKTAKDNLGRQIEILQARLEKVRATEEVKNIRVDDSEFNTVRALVDQLDKQLKVRERVADAETQATESLIPVEDKVSAQSLLNEVDAHLGGPAKSANIAAATE